MTPETHFTKTNEAVGKYLLGGWVSVIATIQYFIILI